MDLRIPFPLGGDDAPGFIHVDVHTDLKGHALVTSTLGVPEVEKRLRDVLGGIARDIERAVEQGVSIE